MTEKNKIIPAEEMQMEPRHEPTPEEIAAWEQERAAEQEQATKPFRDFNNQQADNTVVIDEHDNMMDDMLYELTMIGLEG